MKDGMYILESEVFKQVEDNLSVFPVLLLYADGERIVFIE